MRKNCESNFCGNLSNIQPLLTEPTDCRANPTSSELARNDGDGAAYWLLEWNVKNKNPCYPNPFFKQFAIPEKLSSPPIKTREEKTLKLFGFCFKSF